ncbi:MAG: hypothetical protein GY853_16185 [PVC group bacterium]|nr:hypothetical protein [PVC group bacterium]
MKVKVGFVDYIIKYVKDLRVQEDKVHGYFDSSKQTTYIEFNDPVIKRKCIILHEIIHMWEHEYGIEFEENEVKHLAYILHEFLNNNKNLIKYIWSDE